MGTRGPKPIEAYRWVIEGLRRGEFTSLAEAGRLAGVTGQRVGQWVRVAGIEWKAIRLARVKARWLTEMRHEKRRANKISLRWPNKRKIRSMTDSAVKRAIKAGLQIKVLPPERR